MSSLEWLSARRCSLGGSRRAFHPARRRLVAQFGQPHLRPKGARRRARGFVGHGRPAGVGRGIGRRLLRACIAKAWAQGITRIELEVRVDNEPAIALCRAFGFEQEAVKRRAMRFDGVYHDALLMSLLKDAG